MLNIPVTYKNENPVMSSVDLAKICVGDTKNAHSHFMEKAKKVLGEQFPNFREQQSYRKGNGSYGVRFVLFLPEREACLMAMSYSYELQAHVFDEWQRLKSLAPQPLKLSQDDQLLQLAQGVIRLTAERDEAIRTKAQINDRRTATLMAKASHDSKRIKKLEDQLQTVGDYRSMLAAKLPQRVDTEFKSNVQSWRLLKEISDNQGHEVKKVTDARYGEVNTYHVDVIAEFKELYI